jgi:hypothetical protein
MAGTFVPFFEKATSSEALPQYQFNKFSQQKLAKITLTPAQSIRHVEKDELKTKVLSDLKNALNMSLPQETVQQILGDLAKYRSSGNPVIDASEVESDSSLPSLSPANSEKPNIKLQKDGDRVTHIIVECECGQVITMDCIY